MACVGFRGGLQVGRHPGEEVEPGPRLDGVDAGHEGAVVVVRPGVGLVRIDEGDALGGGRHARAAERTLHDAFVEVARDGDILAAAGQRFRRPFIQHAGHHIQHRGAAARGHGDDPVLEVLPDAVAAACDAAVEPVLPLRSLVAVVEGLLVLGDRALAVLRGDEMAPAVSDRAGIVQARLLGQADGRVACPAFIPAHIVVRPEAAVHRVGRPDRGVFAAVVEDHVVQPLDVRTRVVGVNGDLAVAARCVVAIPLIVAVAVAAACLQANVHAEEVRHHVVREVAGLDDGLGDGGERANVSFYRGVAARRRVHDVHHGLILVLGRRVEAFQGCRKGAGADADGLVRLDEGPCAGAGLPVPEADVLRFVPGGHS